MSSVLRVGIVGLGVISRFYLKALEEGLPGVELAAVCDLNPEVLAPYEGRVPVYRDHRALLAGTEVDAVVVNVPNDAHHTVVRDALSAGRAVCVEKPLAITVAEGRELRELAARRGVVLFTAFHRRYNAPVLRLRDEVLRRTAAGARLARVTVRYWEKIEEHVGRDQWYLDAARCGGGCVADNGPNALDLVHLFVGEVALTRAAVTRDAAGADRQALLELAAPDGTEAVVDLDWSYAHGEVKDVTVRFADGAVLTADMLDGYPAFKSSLAHEYVGVLKDLVRIVRGESSGWPDGLRALELVHDTYAYEAEHAAGHPDGAAGTDSARSAHHTDTAHSTDSAASAAPAVSA